MSEKHAHKHQHHHSGGEHHHHSSGASHIHSDHSGAKSGEGEHHAQGDAAHAARSKWTHEYLDSQKHRGTGHHNNATVAGAGADTARTSSHEPAVEPRKVDIPPARYGEQADRLLSATQAREVHSPGLDHKRSISEMIAAGTFKGAREIRRVADPSESTERDVTKNPVKNVEVVYQDQSGDASRPKPNPDFRIKQDGTVEVLRNPDHTTTDKIVVELERPAGDRSAPPEAQQKAVDNLVNYISGRYMPETKQPDGTTKREGQITDEQGLVSDNVKKSLHTQGSPEDKLPPEAREQVQNINRWRGSGGGRHGGDGGRFSPREGREQFAPRTVPRQPGEDDKIAAIKDVSSGFFSRNEKEPYRSARHDSERGWRVGRYGVDHRQYHNWLMGLSEEEIEKLIKEGKLPPGALDMKRGKNTPEAAKFKGFLDKMKDGKEPPSKEEIDHFMPKTVQERMGSDLVKEYAIATADKDEQGRPTRVDIGRVALSMELGRAATKEDWEKPENQALMQAAERAYPLALRRAMEGDIAVDLSDASRKVSASAKANLGQQLWRNHAAATEWGNLGCAAAVSAVLRDAGVARIDELSVVGLAAKLKSQGWQARSFDQRQPGDVIIATGPRHGHTGVVGEHRDITYDNHSSNGRWSQDSAGYWTRGRWPTVYVLRPPSA